MKIHHAQSALVPLLLLVACGDGAHQGGEGGGGGGPAKGGDTTTASSAAPAPAPGGPSNPSPKGPAPAPGASGATSPEALAALRKNVADTRARAEHVDPRVQVEHILIAFAGAQRARATRTREEAEALAARLLDQIGQGADFSALRKANSDDPGPGIYAMVVGLSQGDEYPRSGMARAFGDTGWRLKVGEIGVAAYDPDASPFGWHIIKRLE
jgi:hypothetical protein